MTYGPEPYCRSHLRNSFELSPSFHSRHPETAYKLIAIRWNSAAVCMNLARFRLFQQKSAQLLMRCAVYLELCAQQQCQQTESRMVALLAAVFGLKPGGSRSRCGGGGHRPEHFVAAPHAVPRDSGRSGSLILQRMEFSFTTPCRF